MPEIFSGKTTKNPRPLVVVVGSLSTPVDGDCLAGIIEIFFYGEFDPGSGRTLAACLTHASRTLKPQLAGVDEWRTGE